MVFCYSSQNRLRQVGVSVSNSSNWMGVDRRHNNKEAWVEDLELGLGNVEFKARLKSNWRPP